MFKSETEVIFNEVLYASAFNAQPGRCHVRTLKGICPI